MYNRFYFFHIDKTISLPIDIVFMGSLYKKMKDNNIDISLNDKHFYHNRWREFDSKTFIFSVFRDPMFRTLADFTYTMVYNNIGIRRVPLNGVHTNTTYNYSLENFEKWLYTVHTPNYQSQLIHHGLLHVTQTERQERIDRINIFIKDRDLEGNFNQKKVYEKILDKIGITSNNIVIPHMQESIWHNGHALGFYRDYIRGSSLEQEIYKLNYTDLEIYNNNNNFTLL